MVLLFTSYGRIINLSTPMLVTGHYPYCKACIKAYIESIGEKACHSILTRLEPPMMENEKGRVPKPEGQWTVEEECLTKHCLQFSMELICKNSREWQNV
ncbi:hypothetical protein Goari_019744, partial [Gossypium aridum]|nr:hypothetical protein [Gossypium aridum]